MKIIQIVAQIVILYGFYYIGVFIVKLTGLPLPASIIGLLLLFIALQLKWIKVEMVQLGAGFLIGFMTLFFIPPIVGIIDYPQLLSIDGIILMTTVVVSTVFAIYITGIISQKIEKKEQTLKERKGGEVTIDSTHYDR